MGLGEGCPGQRLGWYRPPNSCRPDHTCSCSWLGVKGQHLEQQLLLLPQSWYDRAAEKQHTWTLWQPEAVVSLLPAPAVTPAGEPCPRASSCLTEKPPIETGPPWQHRLWKCQPVLMQVVDQLDPCQGCKVRLLCKHLRHKGRKHKRVYILADSSKHRTHHACTACNVPHNLPAGRAGPNCLNKVAFVPLQAMIEQLMAEWHVKDFAVAESIFKSRQRQLKQKSSSKIKARMQVSRAGCTCRSPLFFWEGVRVAVTM